MKAKVLVIDDAPANCGGHRGLGRSVPSLGPRLIVPGGDGGNERAVVAALAAAGLPIVVANPRQVRDFAKATGPLAKTDERTVWGRRRLRLGGFARSCLPPFEAQDQ